MGKSNKNKKKADWSKSDYLKMLPKKKKKGDKKWFKENVHLFGMLSKANKNKKQKEAVIDLMDKKQISGVKKLADQFLKAKYSVPELQLKKLKKDRDYIYKIAEASTPWKVKKKIISQRGGFISALIPLAANAILGPVFDKLFK